jgi:two-component system sensor kinase
MTTDDQPAMERHPNHVLVIEDEEGHAELIRRSFKSYQQDFHLTFAGSLLDARNRINKNPPDLIIADWLLPDGKGVGILPPDREAITIPVIIMTSHGNEELAVEMMKAGVVDYIVKSESSFVELPHIAQRALRDWGNIVQRTRAEEALRESEEKFRSLVEHALEGILILDLQGTILFANNAAARTIEADDCAGLIGRNVMEFIAPESREDVVRDFIQVSQGHDAYLAQYNAISAKGNKFCVESIGKVISYEGKPADLISIQDITERKRAEDALRESEERYRILTDAAHDAIYTLSPEGVVRYVNSGGAALIGMPPEKIVGLSLGMLYHAEIAQEFRENLDKVISTKRPVRYDAKFWHENPDRITWLDAQLVPQLGPDGSVVQVIGISRSITDRKQAELLLKRFNRELDWQVSLRTAELEHTNTLLGAAIIQRTLAEESVRKSLNERELLLREIHHRVKNNLQIILSLISLQSRNIKDQKVLDTMGEFQNRIMAMAHVHERMCRAEDISRIDLSEICTFLGTSLFKAYKVDPQQIRLNVETKDLQIAIDSAIPISLIINELVSNSIKHAFPKGTHGEITIAGRREADTLVLSIRDTGIGIPKDFDWMRSTQSLGLRLVAGLVGQVDGTIELDRTTGTAFNIVVKEKL